MTSNTIENLFTQRIRIGVTGFSRAGKTLFISSLVQALLSTDNWKDKPGQGPLAHFAPAERGVLRSAKVRNDIHSHLPQFPFIKVRNSLVQQQASWPAPTEGISHLVVDLDYWSKRWYRRLRHVQTLRCLGKTQQPSNGVKYLQSTISHLYSLLSPACVKTGGTIN